MNLYQYEKLVLNDTAQVWCSNNVIWKYVLNSMTLNIWRTLLSTTIWASKIGLISGGLAKLNLECIFTSKTSKVKEITHNLNHDLIFYSNHNPLSMSQDKISVSSTWDTYFLIELWIHTYIFFRILSNFLLKRVCLVQ